MISNTPMQAFTNQPIQTISNDKSILYIQQLHAGVTKELLFKEFQKYGQLKHVRHFPKTFSALIAYENISDAQEAKRKLNHTRILNKEISIAYFEDKNTLDQKKKFNLFIKNVPTELETSVLHNFLQSEFGNVASLVLKKKESDTNENLGYGYVQFENEDAFNKIIECQEANEQKQISIPNSTLFFNVQQFSSIRPKTKINKIHITGLFENGVSIEEQQAKQQQITDVFEEIKKKIGDKQNFSFHSEYNDQKKNFWILVEFSYSNDEDEDSTYQAVKEAIAQNFKYTNSSGAPQITFKANEYSERNLILLGVKTTVNEAILAEWLLKNLNIVIPTQNIRLKHPNQAQKIEQTAQPADETKPVGTYTASLFFDSKKDGEKFMIFCSKANNTPIVNQIFEIKHKVTLFMRLDSLNIVKKLNQNMGNIYKGNNFQQNTTQKTEVFNQKLAQPFLFNPMSTMPFPFQPPQNAFFPVVPIQTAPNQIVTPKENPQLTNQNANKPTNIFIAFQKLSPEQKKLQVEEISQKINTSRDEFNQISDEEGKRAILGQIIYYKIQNFGETNKAELIKELNKTPEEATKLITDFHQEVAKITGMLIDKDIFQIEEIIEIVLNPKELLERCLEATDLLTQNQQN